MFECHITVELNNYLATYEMLAKEYGWKTSHIYGDVVLGQNPYFYFTCHNKDFMTIFEKMQTLTYKLVEVFKIEVIRKKIELIVYDTKMKI